MIADGQNLAPGRRAMITIAVMLASILTALDTTIANVALPHIRGSLSATLEQMGWVLTSYIVATAIMTPLAGWLAGRVGRRKVLLISIAGFTLTSALCGIATSLSELVLFRALQGAFGASLVPMSQAVLLDINPPEHHGRATAIWAMGVTVGPIIGPALGGWLTDDYSWRWVFYINIPFGILSLAGIALFVPESQIRRSRFDIFGFATLSIAIGALQVMLDRGQLLDWFNSTEICAEALICGLSFYLFLAHTFTSKSPFVSPVLFADRNFAIGNLFVFIVGVVLFATLALLPPLLQDLMGYPVITTGLVTAPRGIGTFLTMMIVGRLVGRMDSRLLIAAGFVATAVSLWLMCGLSLQMDSRLIIWGGYLQGIGTGLVYVPLAAISFATLTPQLRSEGTAIFSLLRNVGSSIGIAVVQAQLTRSTQVMHARLADQLQPFGGHLQAKLPFDITTIKGLVTLNGEVTRQAQMIAYNNDFKMLLVLTVAVAPLLLLLRKPAQKLAPAEAVAAAE
jgi:MFS transporter, DHA2 family, multidrug resistance protein